MSPDCVMTTQTMATVYFIQFVLFFPDGEKASDFDPLAFGTML